MQSNHHKNNTKKPINKQKINYSMQYDNIINIFFFIIFKQFSILFILFDFYFSISLLKYILSFIHKHKILLKNKNIIHFKLKLYEIYVCMFVYNVVFNGQYSK